MTKTRKIVKSCPQCKLNVAVASKSCKCGHSFFNTRRIIRGQTPEMDERRRTSRVRREKPNYYDSQEFDKKNKKKDKRGRRKAAVMCPEVPVEEKIVINKDTTAARAKRRRLRKEVEDGGDDLCAKFPIDKQEIATTILLELNRKLCGLVALSEML